MTVNVLMIASSSCLKLTLSQNIIPDSSLRILLRREQKTEEKVEFYIFLNFRHFFVILGCSYAVAAYVRLPTIQ
jgi:hypothetical protein